MAFRRNLVFSLGILAAFASGPVVAQSNRALWANQATVSPRQTSSLARQKKPAAIAHTASPASSGLNFAAAASYNSGGYGGNSIAVGDVNADGFPDLVVADWCASKLCPSGSVAVLLGNGDGTFQTAVPYASGGLFADSVAIADLRGAGKMDIIVGNCGSVLNNICVGTNGGVGVLLGNGDGTFQTAITYSASYGVAAVAAADVTGDGKPDLLLATNCLSGTSYSGCVGVLSGNGDGTFASVLTYSSGGYSPGAIAVDDVNGDNKLDVVVAHCGTAADGSCGTGNAGVLLGNGDGTFAAGVVYDSAGIYPDGVVIADVNGDGQPDVVVANSSTSLSDLSGDLGVLLGNGDGTFQPVVAYPSGGFGAASLAVLDVNGDGKLDMVVANCSSTSGDCTGTSGTVGVGVLLGIGNGTFQAAVTYASGGNTPFGIAVADLNADSKPDLVVANCEMYMCGSHPGTIGVLLNGSLGRTKTTLASSASPATFGQSVTFTATVTSGFKGTPTGAMSFFSGTTNVGSSALDSSGVASLTTSTLAAGNDSITATYAGDTNFLTSTSSTLAQAVHSVSTTSLSVSSGTVALGASVTLSARVSSTTGNPSDGEVVTFEDASTSATLGTGALANGIATFTSKNIPRGTYSVVASYPGDANTVASVSSEQPLQVLQDGTTTSLSISSGTVPVGSSVTLSAKVSSTTANPADGETVTFMDSSTNKTLGTGTLSSGTATFTSKTIGAGTYSVVASYPGDANTQASVSSAVALNVQNFTLSATPSKITVSGPGQMASTAISITTFGSLSAKSVGNWSCSGLPALATCSFGAVNSSNQVMLQISTVSSADLRWPASGHHQGLIYAMLLPGLLGAVSMAGQKRKARGLRMLAVIAVLSLTTVWVACGGGNSLAPSKSGTPAGSSTVTVTATSGTLKGLTTFTLAVQ